MIYNKLVRDKIPNIIKNNGDSCEIEILDDSRYIEYLNKKLLEEVNEYLDSNDIEELADLEEVLRSILKFNNISYDELEEIRLNKKNKRGSFDKKILLKKTN